MNLVLGDGLGMEEWKEKQWTTISLLELYRSLRHEWLNHIQVLMGYLAMNRVEDAKQYLTKQTDQEQHWSHLILFPNAQIVEYFITYPLRYPRIQLQLQVPERLDGIRLSEKKWSAAFLHGLEHATKQALEAEDSLPQLQFSLLRSDEQLRLQLLLHAKWMNEPSHWLQEWQEELQALGIETAYHFLSDHGTLRFTCTC